MRVFSVYGVSGSGKTATIEHLIREMRRRGYRVGTVKNIHVDRFSLDTEGTNTWRHRQAGSEMTVAWGPDETGLFIPRRLGLEELLTFFDQDYVILEGVNDGGIPKILCAHSTAEIEERLDGRVFALAGRIADRLAVFKGIPAISALKETGRLCDLIEASVPEHSRKCPGLRDR